MTLPVLKSRSGAAPVRMSSIPTSPFAEIERVRREFDRLVGDLMPSVADAFTPLADIEETDDAYAVELELPGVAKDDVDLEVVGRRLTVSGERKEKERVGVLRKRTRTVGAFRYEVVLPSEVDADAVTATLDHGVLTITVPKAPHARRRRIAIG